MAGKTVHFLLVYDHLKRELITEETFTDATAATTAYSELERRHEDEDQLEIVLVGADSIETIKRTHASYFESDSTTVTDPNYAGLLIGT